MAKHKPKGIYGICPIWIEALLRYIEIEISRVYWNENQKEWVSAFRNTANTYSSHSFDVSAYNWKDEESGFFKLKDGSFSVFWYKYIGRGMYIETDLSNDEIIDAFTLVIDEIGVTYGPRP